MSEFLFALLRASVILSVSAVVVWLALRTLKVRSALVNQAAWALVLMQGLILVPMTIDLPVLPDNAPEVEPQTIASGVGASERSTELNDRGSIVADDQTVTAARSSFDAPIASDEGAFHESLVVSQPAPAASSAIDQSVETETAAGVASTSDPALALRPENSVDGSIGWGGVLGLSWCIGVLCLALRGGWSYLRFLGEVRNATSAPEAWNLQWQALLARNTKQRATMLCHETLGPMLCRTPTSNVLIVPEELWDDLSMSQREGILQHEMAHLQRFDIWTGLVARVVATLHWFNPLAWLALYRFDEAAEWSCDERAIRQEPRQAPTFAKTLLELVQPASVPAFGASSVQGSPLGVRIKRLVSSRRSDAIWTRASVFALLAGLFSIGAFQLNLVVAASNSEPTLGWAQDESQEDRIAKFASRIVGSSDTAKKFSNVLKTPQGRIALGEQTDWIEGRIRDEAKSDTQQEWIDQNFEKKNGKYHFRADRTVQKKAFMKSVATTSKHVAELEVAMKNVASEIKGSDEASALKRRFLTTKNAAYVTYEEGLKQLLYPDERVVADFLQEYFVRDIDGNYRIRQAYAGEAEETLKRLRRCVKAAKLLAPELKSYADEMAVERLSGQLPARLKNPKVVQALNQIYEGKIAFRSGRTKPRGEGGQEPSVAREKLEQGMLLLERILDSDAAMQKDELVADEALLAVQYWRFIYQVNGMEIPGSYPLDRFWASNKGQWERIKVKFNAETELAEGRHVRTLQKPSEVEPLNLNQRLLLAFEHPEFANLMALNMLFYENDGVRERVNDFFEEVEYVTKDTGRGLVVNDEAEGQVREWVDQFATVERLRKHMPGAVRQFANRIAETTPLEKGLKEILSSPLGAFWIAWDKSGSYEGVNLNDPNLMETLVRRRFGIRSKEADEGDEEEFEGIGEELDEMFGLVRRLRRETRGFSQFSDLLGDSEIKRAFDTPAGVIAAMQQIESMIQSKRIDALSVWIEEHFEETDDGWLPKEGANEAMEEVIDASLRISEELQNDDF